MKDLVLIALAVVLIFILGLTLDAVRWALPAEAQARLIIQVPCGNFSEFQKELTEDHGEQQVATGHVDKSSRMILFVNPTTHTFTIVVRNGDAACTPMAGTDFEYIHPGEPT